MPSRWQQVRSLYEVEGEETGGEHEEEEEDNGEGNFGVEEEHLGRWKVRTTKNVK